eukprot:CAMPEP_0198116554 /NCGR_PEP_ID=MMETSP1442-20131203/13170_1 /TAXON_ID= /ORGANISM="Craspedostauros australis, Strain CCMP3328" /LENGTH=60 /DNA_ID=CAMNT_0043774409 /DNA_START=197 /DNA_END=376 /DNA_ORIENTATION=+
MVQTKFNVGMTCEGCERAVKNVLSKVEGVSDVQTDWKTKTVLVEASETTSKELMLKKLQK